MNIRTGILDYLWECFPWPAPPFKHTEFNLFTHTFKYTDGTGVSYYLRGVAVLPALHVFTCRCRVYIYVCVCVCEYVSIYLSILLIYLCLCMCTYDEYNVYIWHILCIYSIQRRDTWRYWGFTNMILVCSKTGGY